MEENRVERSGGESEIELGDESCKRSSSVCVAGQGRVEQGEVRQSGIGQNNARLGGRPRQGMAGESKIY